MKADEAMKLTEKAYAELAEALAAGKSQALTQYLSAMGRFHNYSFGNLLLIILQKPDATHVAGFHTWRRLGRFVRKGERGIAIIAPLVYRKDDTGSESDSRSIRGFKVVHVFDVSQTDGQELPHFAAVSGDPAEQTPHLKALIQAKGITLTYVDSLNGALGCSTGGEIRILSTLEPAKEFSVLAHELAHEMLHHAKDRPSSKTVRETEAEAVAFVVCRAVGLEPGSQSADYIQLYDGDKDTLAASLDRIQATASEMLTALHTQHT